MRKGLSPSLAEIFAVQPDRVANYYFMGRGVWKCRILRYWPRVSEAEADVLLRHKIILDLPRRWRNSWLMGKEKKKKVSRHKITVCMYKEGWTFFFHRSVMLEPLSLLVLSFLLAMHPLGLFGPCEFSGCFEWLLALSGLPSFSGLLWPISVMLGMFIRIFFFFAFWDQAKLSGLTPWASLYSRSSA